MTTSNAPLDPKSAVLFLDFSAPQTNVSLHHDAHWGKVGTSTALECTTALQFAEVPFSRALDSVDAVSIGGWFFPRRNGEQSFFFRGSPETAPGGERVFRPQPDWVNFALGTDPHGFLTGTINGNGAMPFPHVTLSEVGIGEWHQLVVVKEAAGYHKFYHNGALVHTDRDSAHAGRPQPFRDTAVGEPVRLAMPLGGLAGEAWVIGRELTADEIRADFEAKKERYHPALPKHPVELREMDQHHPPDLWPEPVTRRKWPATRARIEAAARRVLGAGLTNRVPPNPQTLSETDCGSYLRRKVSIRVQPGDRMPAWLLVPKGRRGRVPAVICIYGTTSGAGKDSTIGLSGLRPGSPPVRNYSFALDMVEAGFVAFAPDLLRDGERVKPGERPYETASFYAQFPEWSAHGKDAWDVSCAVDFLQSLDFVDPGKIGMTGHSYGGHTTIFCSALEPRIKVVVANGPVSDFIHHGLHWAVPKGGGASQSLPNLRPYVLDPTVRAPVTFYEFTALIAPRPLLVGQAVGERRPMDEENDAAVHQVYDALGCPERARFVWYAGDHDFPPPARRAAVEWFRQWFDLLPSAAK